MSTFKTTSMAVGDSATIIITDITEGKFGPVYQAKVNGNAVTLQPSGNLKFLADDLAKGSRKLDTPYTITRNADKKTRSGYNVTNFTINEANAASAAVTAPTAVAATNASVADKLAAIRAKRAQSSANS